MSRFGMEDLVTPPPSSTGPPPESATAARAAGMQDFFHLSHGQQKLVLLCRALAKQVWVRGKGRGRGRGRVRVRVRVRG